MTNSNDSSAPYDQFLKIYHNALTNGANPSIAAEQLDKLFSEAKKLRDADIADLLAPKKNGSDAFIDTKGRIIPLPIARVLIDHGAIPSETYIQQVSYTENIPNKN